jgi:3-dehydroquinate synthase
MERLTVGLAERSYPIWVGSGILLRLGEALKAIGFSKRVAVVTNPTVNGLYGDSVRRTLVESGYESLYIELPDGEEFKNLQTLEYIYDELIRGKIDRSCGLIALGGGVVGDITGFAAATYLRGLPFVQVPTTLLSQVDSSVGGKTGVNHPLGKNLIGAFHQPSHVHIDVDTLRTLPSREFAAGIAEVVKYGMIRDRDFFKWLSEEREAIANLEPDRLIRAVKRSCQIKADVVEKDERETSVRAVLNFGHTFGHAVETLAGYGRIKHGEAVAIGMIVAATAASEMKLCSREDVAALRSLLTGFGLPTVPPSFPLSDYLQAMGRDKKVKEGMLRMVLNRGIGDCVIQDIADPEMLFRSVLETLHTG